MQNPFTTTFSKTPEYTYIETDEIREVIENFAYNLPSESVYKITGVRGSGKTVNLAKVEEAYLSEENVAKGWSVYRLSPARDLLQQLAASLQKDMPATRKVGLSSLSVSANVLGTGGGFGCSLDNSGELFDIGVAIGEMLEDAKKRGRKILIGIDEVSKTPEMVEFASEFGSWLRAGLPVYLVCTGLYENMHELSNVKNLTFFRRATTVQTRPLDEIRMSEMYKRKLGVDVTTSRAMAKATKGYAFAFQELGNLYFKKHEDDSLEDVIAEAKAALFSYSYEKIWEELSQGDRLFTSTLSSGEEMDRQSVLAAMGDKAANYSVYRQRLLDRGVIHARRGYVSLALPFFGEYIDEYCI